MSHSITLPDDIFQALATYAERLGQTPEAVILAWATEIKEKVAQNKLLLPAENQDLVNDPAFDPWAGFRGISEAKSADSLDRHDYYLADAEYDPNDDPLAEFLGKGEWISPKDDVYG